MITYFYQLLRFILEWTNILYIWWCSFHCSWSRYVVSQPLPTPFFDKTVNYIKLYSFGRVHIILKNKVKTCLSQNILYSDHLEPFQMEHLTQYIVSRHPNNEGVEESLN